MGFWSKVLAFAAENYTPFEKHLRKNPEELLACSGALGETEHVSIGRQVLTSSELSFLGGVAINGPALAPGRPSSNALKDGSVTLQIGLAWL